MKPKKKMAMSFGCLMMVGVLGCCNIGMRADDELAPYACAPHPYFCTAGIWQYVVDPTHDSYCGTMAYIMIELWPFFVVDEVFEVALDTVFLPVDLTSMYCLTEERRKKVADYYERQKSIADYHERRKKGETEEERPVVELVDEEP